jgi:hypothetical protein
MCEMFIPCLVVDQYIIEEYQKLLPQLSSKDMVHARLESGWCIGKYKRHDQELKVSEMALECCLLNGLLPDVDLMVS